MKYLEKYKNYTENFMLTEEDYAIIEQELLKKFKENNIEPNAIAFYYELKTIKTDPKNSYTIPIIIKLYNDKYNDKYKDNSIEKTLYTKMTFNDILC